MLKPRAFFFIVVIFRVRAQGEMEDPLGTLKYYLKNVNFYKINPDTPYDDKEILEGYEKSLSTMIANLRIQEDEDHFIIKVHEEMEKIMPYMEKFKIRHDKRKKTRLILECVQDIRKKNLRSAVTKLYLINDMDILNSIIATVYNKNDSNFDLLMQFADEIPSLSITLTLYKTLNSTVEKTGNFTPKKGLELMQAMKKNVILQVSANDSLKTEANFLLEKTKTPVKIWISKKFEEAIEDQEPDTELTEIVDKIIYEMEDAKFLNELCEIVIPEDILQNYPDNFISVVSEMRPISHIILANNLYEAIVRRGINANSIPHLIDLQNSILDVFENVTEENKKLFNIDLPDLKLLLVKIYKSALKENYYGFDFTDQISIAVYNHDFDFYNDVIESTIEALYGKEDMIKILDQFRKSSHIPLSIIGYATAFQKLKENGDVEFISKNIGTFLKLNALATETLEMENIIYVHTDLVSMLKDIQYDLLNTKEKVYKILENFIYYGNYSKEEHDEICKKIFEAHTFGYFSRKIARLYGKVNEERLLDYIMDLPLFLEKRNGLMSLQNEIDVKKIDDILFKLARNYKKLDDEANLKIKGSGINIYDKYVSKLPYSLRNAIFAQEVYLKWTKKSEFLSLNGTLYTLKSGEKGAESKWKIKPTDDPMTFKIQNSLSGDYLYAREGNIEWDQRSKKGSKWRLILTQGGVRIKNVAFRKYLHPEIKSKDAKKRLVSLWPPGSELLYGEWVVQEVFFDPI